MRTLLIAFRIVFDMREGGTWLMTMKIFAILYPDTTSYTLTYISGHIHSIESILDIQISTVLTMHISQKGKRSNGTARWNYQMNTLFFGADDEAKLCITINRFIFERTNAIHDKRHRKRQKKHRTNDRTNGKELLTPPSEIGKSVVGNMIRNRSSKRPHNANNWQNLSLKLYPKLEWMQCSTTTFCLIMFYHGKISGWTWQYYRFTSMSAIITIIIIKVYNGNYRHFSLLIQS